jgi:engulfment/cell motility protein 1
VSNHAVQTITVALINAMLQATGIIGRSHLLKEFDDLGIRQIILQLNPDPSKPLSSQMIEFQTLLAQDMYLRRKREVSSRMNSSGSNQVGKRQDAMIDEIRDISSCVSWKQVGFTSETPRKDFVKTGHLGLETLHAIVVVF